MRALILIVMLAAGWPPPGTAGDECVVVGPPEFQEGSEAYCSYGIFTKVEVMVDKADRTFQGKLYFNMLGHDIWIKQHKLFFDEFGVQTATCSMNGWDCKTSFFLGDYLLGQCKGGTGDKKGSADCKLEP